MNSTAETSFQSRHRCYFITQARHEIVIVFIDFSLADNPVRFPLGLNDCELKLNMKKKIPWSCRTNPYRGKNILEGHPTD